MKKLILFSLVFSFGLMLSVNNYAQTKEKKKTDKTTITKDKQTVEKLNTVCPVSREEIDEDGVIVKYKGKSYQVCCKKCAVKFNNDPEKYLKRMKDKKGKVKKHEKHKMHDMKKPK